MSRLYSIITQNSQIPVDTEGPCVSSEDPNERKIARQRRIQRRAAAIKVLQIKEKGEVIEEQKDPICIQMEKSVTTLETLLKESEEYLENVKVANEAREIDRRESDGVGKTVVLEKLEAETLEAQNQFNEIAGKWSGIQEYKDPLHINDDMLELKIKCDELIQQKDKVIEMLKKELVIAERKFTRDQYKQNQDIRILSQRIEKQIIFMKSAYNKEFLMINMLINEEKQKYVEKSYQKWEDLAEKRTEEEIAMSEYMFKKREEMSSNIQKLGQYHEDNFRQSKIKLEMDVQRSQNEFEKIKHLTLSNSERLDYNYQVLKRRENENIIIKAQQKRRIGKLQDTISDVRNKLNNYKKKTSEQIIKTRENILKMQQHILDTESKADQFAKINNKKFNDIWEMNAKECYGLLEKIIKVDRILHEQQMGVKWIRPIYQKIDKTSMPSYNEALNVINKQSSLHQKSTGSKTSPHTSKAVLVHKTINEKSNSIYWRLLKYILTKLSNKSGFLTEKCMKQLLYNYEDKEQSLVTLNNVFIALDIKHTEDIDLMVDFFLPYCYCPVCSDFNTCNESFISSALANRLLSQASSSPRTSFGKFEYYNHSIAELEEACEAIQQSDAIIDDIVLEVVNVEAEISEGGLLHIKVQEKKLTEDYHQQHEMRERRVSRRRTITREADKTTCKNNHPLVLSTVYVIPALKDFVNKFHKQMQTSPTTGERLLKKRHTVSRLIEDEDIYTFWTSLKNVYKQSNTDVWNSLHEGLMRYLEVLKERKHLSEEVVSLRKRNKELKKLVAEYMDHGVLMKPPCCLQT